MDPIFHTFCRDIYLLYLREAEIPDAENTQMILKHMPGMFKMLDDAQELFADLRFPKIQEVRERYAKWQGELDLDKKWSPVHFLNPPDFVTDHPMTVQDWMSEHNIHFKDVERLL